MDQATKPCTKCAEIRPLTAFNRLSRAADGRRSRCRDCDAAYNRERYRRNPEKIRAAVKRWESADPERARRTYREGCRRWRAKNPGAGAEYMRARRAADPELAREVSRRWAQQNPEKVREKSRRYAERHKPWRRQEQRDARRRWRVENRDKCAASLRRYRARKKTSIVVRFTLDQLAARMSMFAGCWMCGGTWVEVEHVKPLSKGGAHCLANLRPACRTCNAKKSDKWPYPTAMPSAAPGVRLP